jgi:hypothetical protein
MSESEKLTDQDQAMPLPVLPGLLIPDPQSISVASLPPWHQSGVLPKHPWLQPLLPCCQQEPPHLAPRLEML